MIARPALVSVGLAGLFVLAACAGVQPAGFGAPQTVSANQLNARQLTNRARLLALFEQRRHRSATHRQGFSPDSEAAKKQKNLLYVADGGNGSVLMYAYPTLQPRGKLDSTSDVQGVCSDKQGDVWIVPAVFPQLSEYAHGVLKSKATLSDAGAQYPFACSVDPTTGNLAMTNLGTPTGGGNIFIWAGAQGTPTKIGGSTVSYMYFCAYDASGNLWVDGLDSKYNFVFAEVPAGGQGLKSVPLSGIAFPGGIQWGGKLLAVGDQMYQSKQTSAINEVSLAGSAPVIVGTTPLNGSCDVTQFSILSAKVFAPDVCTNQGSIYTYPTGGDPLQTITGLQYPLGSAISIRPSGK